MPVWFDFIKKKLMDMNSGISELFFFPIKKFHVRPKNFRDSAILFYVYGILLRDFWMEASYKVYPV